MAEDTAKIAASVSAAVTGEGTPDSVTVKRPAKEVLQAIFITLLIVNAGIVGVIGVLAYGPLWIPTEAVALARINGLKWIGWLLCGDMAMLVFAIASPLVGRVEAAAGTNHVTLEGRQ